MSYYGQLISESILFNEKDIYYNKDKFDSGEINLCFITGHSGSGKSTMAHTKESDDIEAIEMDDLQCISDYFSMDQLKEYGSLIYSYFTGPGKKFYIGWDIVKDTSMDDYEGKYYPDFVNYCKQYAKSHKDKKFIIEGVELFGHCEGNKRIFKPEEFKDYAFYIKGTSMIISKHRAALRDAKDATNKKEEKKAYRNNFFKNNWKWYFVDEKDINKFRNYFRGLMKEK